MQYLDRVLYRKWLQDARATRCDLGAPAHRCFVTGLRFDDKTRTESFWAILNRIQQLRAETAA